VLRGRWICVRGWGWEGGDEREGSDTLDSVFESWNGIVSLSQRDILDKRVWKG